LGAALVLLVAALAVVSWRHYHNADPLKGLKPALYQPTQHVSGETLPLPGHKK
jgi:hypothetical protein